MCKVVSWLWIIVFSAAVFAQQTTEGSLYAVGKTGTEVGACPLKNTAVKVDVSGFISRVRVRQEFQNSYAEPIEAIYVFPLSQNGAVDEMTMTVGTRVIRSKIMRREEARKTYENAKTEGKTTSLLDQERPNIFTQSVANIMPGEKVVIEITYVETLKYEDGAYEFVFPMIVGPRYIPAGVTDAERIKPPVAERRNGSDISIEVNLNAGVPVESIRSTSHQFEQINFSPNTSRVTLRGGKTIPNKDFILKYDVTGKRIEDAILVHRGVHGGFFTVILQPPDKIATEDRTPKEIVFVLDTSGSMSGLPIEKAKDAMKLSLEGLYPDDTFNLITFSGDTHILFEKPVLATRSNLDAAQAFLGTRKGSGGTVMMKAVKAALDPSDSSDHLRIVCFMTDGYVGNDNEIIAEIQKHPNARVFAFGIGNSVNRFLLDKMAAEGKGEVEYVGLGDDGSKAARKFYERVRTPLLTDLSIEWHGLPVADVYPGRLPDLFSTKPVILHGRYTKAARGLIKIKGKVAGQDHVREVPVFLPETERANDVLSMLWARTRIDELSSSRLKAGNQPAGTEIDTQITNIGLEFGLLTSFTSFVAVEDRVVNQSGKRTTIQVPVERPDGWGDTTGQFRRMEISAGLQKPPAAGGQVLALQANSRNVSAGVLSAAGSRLGSGQGSAGLSTGTGSASGNAMRADVSSGRMENTEAMVMTNITAVRVESLPPGTDLVSLLRSAPGTVINSPSGGFAIDAKSRAESSFVVDGTDIANVQAGNPANRNVPRLSGRTTVMVEPDYSNDAREAAVLGDVEVEIKVNRGGTVVSAMAVSGDLLLRTASESAAKLSKFAPTISNGRSIRVGGIIVYKFVSADKIEVFVRKMKAEKPTDAEIRVDGVAGKLHFWLFDVVDRLATGDTGPAANEASFVRDGKANIQVELTVDPATVIEKLQKEGFEIVATKGKMIVSGRIALDKIIALAEVEEVKSILPKI